MTGNTVQVNTRIDRSLKERGDAALKRAGYSPSQAVRTLWEFAAKHQHNPKAIQEALDFPERKTSRTEQESASRASAIQENLSVCTRAYAAMGIEPSAFTSEASYAELREYAALERLKEQGRA